METFFLECDWSCNACSGPLRTDCLQCMDDYVLQDGVCMGQCSPGHYRDAGFCKRKYLSVISAEPMANFRLASLLVLVSFPRAVFVVSDESPSPSPVP